MLLVANGSVFTRNAQTRLFQMVRSPLTEIRSSKWAPRVRAQAKYPDAEYVDAQGNLIMPGLINCHTTSIRV